MNCIYRKTSLWLAVAPNGINVPNCTYNVSMRLTAKCSIISSHSPSLSLPLSLPFSLRHFFQRIVHRYRRANYSVAMAAVGRFVAFNWRRTKWSIMPCIIIGNFYVACARPQRAGPTEAWIRTRIVRFLRRAPRSPFAAFSFFFSFRGSERRSYALRKNACDHVSSHRCWWTWTSNIFGGLSCALSREQRILPVSSFFY